MQRKALALAAVTLFLLSHAAPAQEVAGRDYADRDLTNANFLHADLRDADFSGAILRGAVFGQADLTHATFRGAIFGTAGMGPTSFVQANLTGADFRGVRLETTTDFQYADITDADFTGLDTRKARFGPILEFDTAAAPPRFVGAVLDCQFPWYWKHLDLTDTRLPTCDARWQQAEEAMRKRAREPAAEPAPTAAPAATRGGEHPRPRTRAGLAYSIQALALPEVAGTRAATPGSGNRVYVATSGTDGPSCGTTFTDACLTVSEGITRCSSVGTPCTVILGYGSYRLASTLTLPDQISLEGGYVPGDSGTYQSLITGPSGGAATVLSGNGVSLSLSKLILSASAYQTQPGSTAAPTSVLTLTNSTVTASEVNLNAATGLDVTASGAAGTASNGGAGNSFNLAPNGAGGTSSCTNANGGEAGQQWLITSSCGGWAPCHWQCFWSSDNTLWFGLDGLPGQSTGGAGSKNPGDACAYGGPGPTPAGGDGGTGADASVQAAASSHRAGQFSPAGVWTPSTGAQGNPGNDGGGGGGGGAGQANLIHHCPIFGDGHCDIYNGVAGGGGGGGGCGATGGQGGVMGSGSFGVVLVDSTLTVVQDLIITGAQGGNGGDGGPGVAGGAGGAGGANCNCQNAAGQMDPLCSTPNCGGAGVSGAGGNGGQGGASGGGGGGNGGPSIGIVLIGGSSYSKSPTSVYPGTSGAPGDGGAGAGTAPAGSNGQSGLAQAVYAVGQQ